MFHISFRVFVVCLGGAISCVVTGSRRYSADLPQGGLEVPSNINIIIINNILWKIFSWVISNT